MGDETKSQHKATIKLAHKPLIEWQRDALRRCGLSPIIGVTGYAQESVAPFLDVIIRNDNWESTEIMESLMCADEVLAQNSAIISYGDIVYHPSVIESLLAAKGDIIIASDDDWLQLWTLRFANPLDDAESFISKQGKLQEIGKRANSLSEIQGQYMGLIRLSPEGWRQIRDFHTYWRASNKKSLQVTQFLNHFIEAGGCVQTCTVHGRWCELDSTKDLEIYRQKLQQNTAWSHDWRF